MTDIMTKVSYETGDHHRFCVNTEVGERILISQPLTWESEFFGKTMRRLDLVTTSPVATLSHLMPGVDRALMEHDALGVAITQLNLDFNNFNFLCHLEDRGFRSVDTRAAFVTLVTPGEIPVLEPPFGRIVDLAPEHLSDILNLVRSSFSKNKRFHSRFKNQKWFTKRDSERYYDAWIKNTINKKEALGAVWVHEGEILGFFLYQYSGEKDGIPLCKGVLAAVHLEYQGHSAHLVMQNYLYRKMPEKVWLDNTTQLSNIGVIRNHMLSVKRLESFTMVLYRSGIEPG